MERIRQIASTQNNQSLLKAQDVLDHVHSPLLIQQQILNPESDIGIYQLIGQIIPFHRRERMYILSQDGTWFST